MTVTRKYRKTVRGTSSSEFVHQLALAAIEHGHRAGATMEPLGDRPVADGGEHSLELEADNPTELADELGKAAVEMGEHLGFKVVFNDTAARTEPPPVDFPDVTYHLVDEETGQHIESVTTAQRAPDGRSLGLPDRVHQHLRRQAARHEAQVNPNKDDEQQ